MLKDIIVESVDRLGKNTLIDGVLNALGFFQEIHYQKPRVLELYLKQEDVDESGAKKAVNHAQKRYQIESFYNMFRMLSNPGRFIMNRAHLGEHVYAPRYRNYSGDYVFDLERQFTNDHGSSFTKTTLLVLLTTSDFGFIQDDGLSFDFDKKEEEQEDFKRAFAKSTIENKLLIDVSNGAGGYRSKEDILAEVVSAYTS